MKNKKAQEEMMGFMIIVVLVVIIGLVFLGFSLRQKSKNIEPQSMNAEDLLQSMLVYTSDCQMGTNALNVRDLIRVCNTQRSAKCDNNEIVCEKVNSTLRAIMNKTMGQNVGKGFIHGYSLEINATQYLLIEKGNTTGNYFSSFIPLPLLVYGQNNEAMIKLRYYYG